MYTKKYYPKKIYLNGRFLTQTITGVQRYAIEVIKYLDSILENRNSDKYHFVLLTPKNIKYNINLKNISVQKVGNFQGVYWEQFEIPFYSFGHLLINFCNTAPVLKKQQILTIHDAAASANKSNYSLLFRTWYILLHHLLPFRTKKIITDSYFSKKELVNYYPIKEKNIEVVYLGANHILRVMEDKKVLEKYDLIDKQYLLAVSSLNPNKNFKGIIDSIKYLEKRDIQLVIVGSTNISIYKEMDIPYSTIVKQIGFIGDGELKALYKNAQAFIFPSFYEGFGLPPLEAMSCGCPVISSNRASLPEVLGNSVIYCDPENPKDIAQQIDRLLKDESLREYYIDKGLKKSRMYTWEKSGRELFKIMEEVLEE